MHLETNRFLTINAYPKICEALERFGIEVGITSPAAAVTRLEQRPAAIQAVGIAALDECLAYAPSEGFRFSRLADRCAPKSGQRSLAERGAAGVEAAGGD